VVCTNIRDIPVSTGIGGLVEVLRNGGNAPSGGLNLDADELSRALIRNALDECQNEITWGRYGL
jgi:hypothetical protein